MALTEQSGITVFMNFLKRGVNPVTSVDGDKTEFKIVDLSLAVTLGRFIT